MAHRPRARPARVSHRLQSPQHKPTAAQLPQELRISSQTQGSPAKGSSNKDRHADQKQDDGDNCFCSKVHETFKGFFLYFYIHLAVFVFCHCRSPFLALLIARALRLLDSTGHVTLKRRILLRFYSAPATRCPRPPAACKYYAAQPRLRITVSGSSRALVDPRAVVAPCARCLSLLVQMTKMCHRFDQCQPVFRLCDVTLEQRHETLACCLGRINMVQ